ncbi:MAG: hypothetical protein ABSF25_14975 [Bryobacteraceae bacterium]
MKVTNTIRRTLWSLLAAETLFTSLLCGQIGSIVVTSGASFQPGMPAKGSIGTIFCSGLSIPGVVSATSLPLPMSLAGVTVTVGGAAAPLFAVADLGAFQQINFQVPLEAVFDLYDGNTEVAVAQSGAQGSATATFYSTTGTYSYVKPGDFFRIGGTQYGIFQHSRDYSLVTEANPANPGETIIAYLTGLPTAVNPPPDGQPAPMSPPSVVAQYNTAEMISQLSLEVGGIGLYDSPPINGDSTGMSPIPFIGLTPGAVGLYQIDFALPAIMPSGDLSVYLIATHCAGTPAGFPAAGPDCYAGGSTWYYSQEVLIPVQGSQLRDSGLLFRPYSQRLHFPVEVAALQPQ